MITTYEFGSIERKALETAASILTLQSKTGARYFVDDCYFDFGQDWMWTTILCKDRCGNEWQALNPREHGLITDDCSLEAILEAVKMTQTDKFNPDK